MAEPRTP